LYLDRNDQSYIRKIKEARLSWGVDDRYSKQKILETCLNEIYFGGVYGIKRAARSGTGSGASLPGIPAAGKTGTADQSKDIWFIGLRPTS